MRLFPSIALLGLLLVPITGCEEVDDQKNIVTEEQDCRQKLYGQYNGHRISKYSHTFASGDEIITEIKIDTSSTSIEISEGSVDTLIAIRFSESNIHQIPISDSGYFYSSYINELYSYTVNFTLDSLNIYWFKYDGMQASYEYNFFGIKKEDF